MASRRGLGRDEAQPYGIAGILSPLCVSWGPFRLARSSGRPVPVCAPLLVYDWRGNKISDLHQYVGKLRVRYVRPAGYCGMDYRLDHQAFAEDMLERMVVEGTS